jgi:hypothetical protein
LSPTPPLRIAYVGSRDDVSGWVPAAMNLIRPYRVAEALARRGHRVDIIVNRSPEIGVVGRGVRELPFRRVRWHKYDVIKTAYHRGFEALLAEGGGDHPFVISRLGEVLSRDDAPGVHFFGEQRTRRLNLQTEIVRRARGVVLQTPANERLWRREYGASPPVLQVPTGVDARIPPLGPSPYRALGLEAPIALFAGNLRSLRHQPEVNRLWQDRLNRLGAACRRRGLHLVVIGPGATDRLDPSVVRHAGQIPHDLAWDWMRHAQVGLVLAQGRVDDNEKSRLCYYLRAGLPAVCERPVANAWLVEVTGHGTLVEYDDVEGLASAAAAWRPEPDRAREVMDYMARHHSWESRVARYDAWLAEATAVERCP